MKYTRRYRWAPARICDTKSDAHNSCKLIVLNYHLLSDYAGGANGPFCVSSAAFVKQLKVIKEKELPVVCLAALINGTFAGDFGVILTFDDGNVSDFHIAFPALQERNLTATFFPVVNNIGTSGYVAWQQLREIARHDDFTIGSHGLSHRSLITLSKHEQQHELECSKALIEQRIGRGVSYFAAPYGLYSKAIVELTREVGYKALMTTTPKVNVSVRRPFVVHRWNIRRRTSLEAFKRMLEGNGSMSPVIGLAFACKRYVQALLGWPVGLADRGR
jgi:peptidoglycan/xylan/chitin deacetylase (PgdA/CDA1 family)